MGNPVEPSEAVKKAKAAVEGLEEPYKMEAFKLILQRLISAQSADADALPTGARKSVAQGGRRNPRSAPSRSQRTRGDSNAVAPTTTLELSVEELGALKSFFESHNPTGSEMCAFVIAAFLRVKKKMERCNVADIEYCYRQLISMKSRVPVVKNLEKALQWLTAPSRKKEWLRKVGEHQFELTNSGLIAINSLEKASQPKKHVA